MDQRDKTLAEIAARHLHLETLETRNSDSFDFHDMAVWSIRQALEAAYEAGRQSRGAAAPKARAKGGKVVAQAIKAMTSQRLNLHRWSHILLDKRAG
jgi:hypothetical protein